MSQSGTQEKRLSGLSSGSLLFYSLLVLIVILGFALRVHDLEGQSMWTDEGLSLYRSGLPAAEIMRNVITVDGHETRDASPPLYFLLLHAWRTMAGDTIFAMRYLGVLGAILAVPLMYRIGAVTFGRRSGVIAALLMAISPFHVWQSQVLRNYGLLLTINLLSVYGLFRYILAPRGRRPARWLIVWAIAGLAGIYVHYFGFLVFTFGLFSLLVTEVSDRGISPLLRQRRLWILGVTGILILLPAGYIAYDRFLAGQQFDFFYVPVTTVIYRAASAFAVGMERSLVHPWWRVLPAVLLAIIGSIFSWRERHASKLLVFGYLAIPLGLLMALSFVNPLYNGTRHLLIGLPPFLLLMSYGIAGPVKRMPKSARSRPQWIWRWLGPLLGLWLVISQLSWLGTQFNSPALIRDDVRGAAEVLTELVQPEDLVVLHDTIISFTFDYYYDGLAPVTSIPKVGQMNVEETIEELQEVSGSRRLLWFLKEPAPRTGFDQQVLVNWADDNWLEIFDQSFPHMWLRVGMSAYDIQPIVATLPDSAQPVSIVSNGALQIHGYEIPLEALSGHAWWPIFFLSRLNTEPELYTIMLRFKSPDGLEWAAVGDVIDEERSLIAEDPETIFRYIHRSDIPIGLPPGRYEVWIQMIRSVSGEILPFANGELEAYLLDLSVLPSDCQGDLGSDPALLLSDARVSPEIELQAFRKWPGEHRPGHPISLDLWWCTLETPTTDYRWRLQIVDDAGQVVKQSSGPLTRPDYPPTGWQPGELIMGQAQIVVPAEAEGDSYELRLSLLPPDSDEAVRSSWPFGRQFTSLGKVAVLPWSMTTEVPPLAHPLRADFGDPAIIEMQGFDISADQAVPGDVVDLELFWRSLSSDISTSYTVFVHLADESEQIFAQGDGKPVGGIRPTTSWRRDEVLVDGHAVPLPADIPPGTYNLWIGFYDLETRERLPVLLNGQKQPDDRAFLQEIIVGD